MLHDARKSTLGKLQRGVHGAIECPERAVPVQAGKVCNHRASPNRHLSSIPRNGYGAANMQCAGRATAHREPLVDGKIRRPVNVGFREAAARHAMAGQSPERADSVEKLFAATANSQKAENCSPLVRIHEENLVKFEGTRMPFWQI